MTSPISIAIDGPVASGKTAVGRRVAERLGVRFLDTGMMYRAATLGAIHAGVDIRDEDALARLVSSLEIRVVWGEAGHRFLVDGQDVTAELRSPLVDGSVSEVSAVPAVRSVMVQQQRAIAGEGSIVMVGRDIGTVVLPKATAKIFLTASAEVRAQRRLRELDQRGQPADHDEVMAALRHRDKIDAGRDDSPLRPDDAAVTIETDRLGVDEVVEIIVSRVESG